MAKVTQVEIARRLGVSQRTISVAFSGSGRISEVTRERIIQTARELGYRPNSAARAIRNGRFGAIGLLTSSRISEAAINPTTNWAIQEELTARSMLLTVAAIPDDQLTREEFTSQLLQNWSVDGVLISYTFNAPRHLLDIAAQHRIPAVWINSKLSHDCVRPDDYSTARDATRALLDRGHRRLGYVCFGLGGSHYSVADRRQGFFDAVKDAGATAVEMPVPAGQGGTPGMLPHVSQWLAMSDRPTGLVTSSEDEAGVVLMAASMRGLAAPRDFSLVSIRNGSGLICGVAVNGMELRHGPVGHRAVEMLLQKIQSPQSLLEAVVVPSRPLEGQTLGSPRGKGTSTERAW